MFAANKPVIISAHGVCHLALPMRAGCTCLLYLLTLDSIGLFSVAYMPVIISVHGICHLAFSLCQLFVTGYSISCDHGFDWNYFCGVHAGDNFCSRSLSSGSLYESGLYLIILSLRSRDSIGILSVASTPVIISVHGVCHLALCVKAGCTWLFYFS